MSYPGALLAGVLSFASPCVLPLVPAYLSFLGGVSFEQVSTQRVDPAVSRRVLLASFAFVLGFITVFVALGASATMLSRVLADHLSVLAKVAGVVVVLFGLHYMGLVRIPFLNYEARFHPMAGRASLLMAYVIGLAFAFGWTPCVGPVLATILTLAATSSSVWHGVLLLALYGIGIGIPFMLAATAIGPFLRIAAHIRARMRWIEVSLGALMVVTGVLIVVGSLASVSGWLLQVFPFLGKIG